MRTLGTVIKDARIKKGLTLSALERLTKIKQGFILAIEKEDWRELPNLAVVSGFVKSIASHLDLNPVHAVALLKRDYPPAKIAVNPKQDVGREFAWSPRLTFLVGISVVILAVLGYLTAQYWSFTRPPRLEIEMPQEGETIIDGTTRVAGKTKKDVTVTVNNQPVLVNEDGSFEAEIELSDITQEISVVARSLSGKEIQIIRKIVVESEQ